MRLLSFTSLFTIILLFTIIANSQDLTSQHAGLQIPIQQIKKIISLREAFSILEKAYDIHILYEENLVLGKTVPYTPIISSNLHQDIKRVLSGNCLYYEMVGAKTLVILPLKKTNKGAVKGIITNKYEEGISGAQVIIQGTTLGSAANLNGEYVIKNILPGTYTLKTMVIGYRQKTASINVKPNETVVQNFSLVQDVIQMDEVVITATRNPLTKRESSVAITIKTLEQINEIAPRNTADLLRVIPGFYVESSGGEVGGNLFARGLPADGSFYYVALMEDGMPVYDVPALSFVNADIFVRVDENIDRIEAVRGGNSALFGSNAPGGVINFISKSGGNKLKGTAKTTRGTGGLARYDFNLNGPVGENWRFNVGGFYRLDDGIRYAGFRGSQGGQIKANLTRLFSNGYIKLYGKYLNDRNIFYLPLPFKAGKDLQFVDGFPQNGTMTTSEANMMQVPTPNGNNFTIPLEDGQKQDGGSLMIDFNVNLHGGWSFQNTTRYMNINHSWNALLPFNLVKANEYAQNDFNNMQGAADYDVVYANHFNKEGSNAAFNTVNGLLCESGLWHVSKPLNNISNQFLIKKNLMFKNMEHKITVGTYYGYYTAADFWYWQDILTDVRKTPRFVDIRIKNANGNIIREVTENGFRKYGSMYMNAKGFVTATSVFFGDDLKVSEKLRMDIGARLERKHICQDTEDVETYNLGGAADADNRVMWGNGKFKHSEVRYNDWAASLGMNYTFNDNLSIYSRVSRGYKMPTLDVFRGADGSFKPDAEELIQGESGIKCGTSSFGVNATVYSMQLENFPSQDARVVDGNTVWVTDYVGKSQTVGMEIEAVAAPVKGFTINAIFTLQDHKYAKFVTAGENFKNNWIQRIPKFIGEILARYSINGFNLGANCFHVGKRYANNANTVELPSFDVMNCSASYEIKITKTQKATIAFNLLNALNGNGLTEGNPRLDNSGPNAGTFYLARPILPRRLKASLTYNF